MLVAASQSTAWTSIDEYPQRIADRNQREKWGLTNSQIDAFGEALLPHAGPYLPEGISMWLDRGGLAYNWIEALTWVSDGVKELGSNLQLISDEGVQFLPGSEQGGECQLTAVGLDIGTFWKTTPEIGPQQVLATRPQSAWPGLSVAWLLALNPQVLLAIDGETVPGFWAPGLQTDVGRMLFFDHSSDAVTVEDWWPKYSWRDLSVVSFRQ